MNVSLYLGQPVNQQSPGTDQAGSLEHSAWIYFRNGTRKFNLVGVELSKAEMSGVDL